MLFMGSRHKPSTASQAWLLQEKDDVLEASECLQQELLQPVQVRGTPCSTILAQRTPGFLSHSPHMLVLFAFNIKCTSSKMTTEPPLPAGCELGCARAAQSVTSWCLSSYFCSLW